MTSPLSIEDVFSGNARFEQECFAQAKRELFDQFPYLFAHELSGEVLPDRFRKQLLARAQEIKQERKSI